MNRLQRLFLGVFLVVLLSSVTLWGASAAGSDRSMDFQLITKVALTQPNGDAFPAPPPGVARDTNFLLTYHFKIPNTLLPEIGVGDYYILDIPQEIPLAARVPENPDLRLNGDPNGVLLATWEIIAGNQIKVTFTDAAGDFSDQGGNFWIKSNFDTTAIGNKDVTNFDFDLGLNGNQTEEISFQKPTVNTFTATKSGEYDKATNEILWTIVVGNGQTTYQNVIVRDFIPENTELVPNSFQYDKGSNYSSNMTVTVEGRLLTFKILQPVSSRKFISYRTKVSGSLLNSMQTDDIELIKNQAVAGHSGGSTHTNEAVQEVPVIYATKSANHDKDKKIIEWTVILNPQSRQVQNAKFTDTFSDKLSYVGDSLKAVERDHPSVPVPLTDVSSTANTLSATLGNISTAVKLTYQTSVADSAYAGATTLSNEVVFSKDGGPDGESEAGASVTTSTAGMITKTGSTYASNRTYPTNYDPATGVITWTIKVNSAGLELVNPVVTDTLLDAAPPQEIKHKLYFDPTTGEAFEIKGLPDGLSYTKEYTGETGLKLSFTGTLKQELTILVKTVLLNRDWVEGNYHTTLAGPRNEVKLEVGNSTSTASAQADITSKVLEKLAKTHSSTSQITFDYVNKKVLYTITVNRNNNPGLKNVIVTDTIMKPLLFSGKLMRATTEIPRGVEGDPTPYYTYKEGTGDVSGILTLYLGNISQIQVFTLEAYLDTASPEYLEYISKPDATKKLLNKITLTHDGLTKPVTEITAESIANVSLIRKTGSVVEGQRVIDWKITINKAGYKNLSGFLITDAIPAGLELDTASLAMTRYTINEYGVLTEPSSVTLTPAHIRPGTEANSYIFDFEGDRTLPEGVYELTFKTYVVAPNPPTSFYNNAVIHFNGTSVTSNTGSASSNWTDTGGSAWGEVGTLRLNKVDEDKPGLTLAGAKFKLLNHYMLQVAELTTDAQGKASYDRLRYELDYHLQEVEPAPGYELDDTLITFSISGSAEVKEHVINRTNKRIGGYKDITATKVWEGWPQGETPPDVYFRLKWHLKDQPVSAAVWVPDDVLSPEPVVKQVTLNPDPENQQWEATWPTLPVQDVEGKQYDYLVVEVDEHGNEFIPQADVDHYTKREVGLTVTNTTVAAKVTISKTEVNGTAELPGATLQVFKGEGAVEANKVTEWVSGTTPKVIELQPGVYTLVEETAPAGYVVAESITFRVSLDGSVAIKEGDTFVSVTNATVHMEDAFADQGVTISKTEVNGTDELPGATLQVFKGEEAVEANKVTEWVSGTEAKVIDLQPGVYTLVEETAPAGYVVAESITFRVNMDGSVEVKEGTEWVSATDATVHMEDAFADQGVTISKTEVNGTTELPGATLQVFKGEEAVEANKVEEWVSGNTAKTVDLQPGVYTLVEETAPAGYVVAESITFRVNLDGSVDIRQAGNWVKAANATVRMQDAKKPKPVEPTPSYDTLRVPLSAKKTLLNGSLRTETFTFVLKDGSGRVIAEANNDQSGLITFPDRTFSRVVSNYLYTIEEKQGTTASITYDATVYTVKVTTKAVEGKLVAKVDILKDGVPYAGDIHFVNTRKLPPTGDNTMRTILILLGAAGWLLAGGLLVSRRAAARKHKQD